MKKKLLAMILSAAMMVTAAPEATVFASDMDYAASAVAEEILEEEELVGEAAEEAEASEEVTETESEDTAEFDASIPEEAPADAEVTEEVPSVETISDDVFNYSVNEKQEAVVTGLKAADAEELVIPDLVFSGETVYTVTGIADNALDGNAKSLVIPATVKAFGIQNLPALETVKVDEASGYFFVQENVLYEIKESTSRIVLYPAAAKGDVFVIGENVGEIAKGAFANAANLKTVIIGKDVKKIEENAFASFANPLTVVFNMTEAPEVASKAFFFDKVIGNVFYFTTADVLEAIKSKTADFVESPFFYDPEGGEKLSDTTGVVSFETGELPKEIAAIFEAKNITVEKPQAPAREEIVGASDISSEDAKIENGYYIIKYAANADYAMHVKNDAMRNQGPVEINTYKRDAVIFKVTADGGGKYRILSFWSNKRLGVNVSVPENGEGVTQRDIKYYNNQQWYIRKSISDPDSVLIVNCANPKVVVTAPATLAGGNLTVKESDGGENQLWKFEAVSDPTIKIDSENYYNIVSAVKTDMAATVADKNLRTSYKLQAIGKFGQRFALKSVGYGNIYKFINFDSNKAVCVYGAQKTPGSDVLQWGDGNAESQRWHLVKTTAKDGSVAYFIKGVGSNLYLTVAGGKTAAGTNIEINRAAVAHKWQFVVSNVKLSIPVGPMIRIISKGNKSLYLTVKGGSEADNTNIDVEAQTKKTDQLWSMVPLGGGYYKMANVSSRNSVSVKSGNKADGANICARPYKSWNSQIWKIVQAGNDGSCYFINKLTGKYLTVKGGKYSSGTNVEQASFKGDNSQKFYFTAGQVTPGWQKYAKTKRYYNADATHKTNSFIENGKYYVDAKGLPFKGWKKYGSYYFYYKGLDGKETMDTRPYLSSLFGTKKTWNGYTAPNCKYYMTIDNTAPCLATVYTKYKGTNSWNLPVFSFLVSPGTTSTPTDFGNRKTRTKYRWKELMGPSWGQYATELLAYTVIAGSSYVDWTNNGEYFHSVACGAANTSNLNPAVYNLLGTRQSHGCVRMCVRYAWWTYTYVDSGTTVYVGANLARPLTHVPQPRAYNSIDPTDPAYTGNYGYTDTRNWVYWNGYLF